MQAIAVRDPTDVAEARRQAVLIAEQGDFGPTAAGRVAIAVTELATNILRHGQGGEMLIARSAIALEILALDKGPGMANLQACLTDGYSTAGTRGEGLGAVARQADQFDVYSGPGLGTAVLARFHLHEAPSSPAFCAGVNICYPGETVCGDAWAVRHDGDDTTLIVADGLGHGLLAAEAAGTAIDFFHRKGDLPPARFLELAHQALRPTRGAATSVARLSRAGVSYAGVGNIAGSLISGGAVRKMISHNGSLGHMARHFQSFDYPATLPALVILHSDGLGSNWNLDAYPGLTGADPALIAGILYRDFSRRRDDVTVLVARRAA